MENIRRISTEFAEAFKQSELYNLYKEHKHELFIGVRNNYLNLYYNCDSIARVEYKLRDKKINCVIDKYYLDGKHYDSKDKNKRYKTGPKEIYAQYEVIKSHSNIRKTQEKKAQSKLVLLNNKNLDSNWFCIDIEYVKPFKNEAAKNEANFNARFDIIALSKKKPYRVALIELKYGKGSLKEPSGIKKHVSDFSVFLEKGYFEEHLKHDIIAIVESQKELGVDVPFGLIKESDLKKVPEFYFIILDNNAESVKASTPKQTLAGYLFKEKRWGCKRLAKNTVENEFGDITKRGNKFFATFLFSKATLDNLEITDIIDGAYDERIPE
ncbi:MAG: hypothetical protein GX372_09325 [Ignavibacteria bacterium]|jgi:hypothetical protein|nr:hypothetical protein [Ignavibacteria bacterium]